MTEILISIQPKWVKKILTLEKRWEMRKSRPRQPGPYRVYIYQTESGGVVGEFVCDTFAEIGPGEITNRELIDTRLTMKEALEYADGKTVYLWRIRSLVDYPEPKPLSAYGLDRPPQSWCYVKGGDPDAADGSGEADRNL
jgi:predicted transcriptional regulator